MSEPLAGRESPWEQRLQWAPQQAIPETAERWWVAHTKPRAEKALGLDLITQGIPFYLPLRRNLTRSRSGRSSQSLIPAFTGYLFFAGDANLRQQALRTNRIVSVLEVPDQSGLVQELRAVQAVLASDTAFEVGPALSTGDWVEVLQGPLEGVRGRVQSTRGRTRLVLSVDMLGQAIVVEAERENLRKLESPSD